MRVRTIKLMLVSAYQHVTWTNIIHLTSNSAFCSPENARRRSCKCTQAPLHLPNFPDFFTQSHLKWWWRELPWNLTEKQPGRKEINLQSERGWSSTFLTLTINSKYWISETHELGCHAKIRLFLRNLWVDSISTVWTNLSLFYYPRRDIRIVTEVEITGKSLSICYNKWFFPFKCFL